MGIHSIDADERQSQFSTQRSPDGTRLLKPSASSPARCAMDLRGSVRQPRPASGYRGTIFGCACTCPAVTASPCWRAQPANPWLGCRLSTTRPVHRRRGAGRVRDQYLLQVDSPLGQRVIEDPYRFGPGSATPMSGCWQKGGTCGHGKSWAPTPAPSPAWPAWRSRSGRPMRARCAGWATSTCGTAAAIRCACGSSAASGKSSFRDLPAARSTSSTCSAPMASAASRATPMR